MIETLIVLLVVALILGLFFYALGFIPFLQGWPLQVIGVIFVIIFLLYLLKILKVLPALGVVLHFLVM